MFRRFIQKGGITFPHRTFVSNGSRIMLDTLVQNDVKDLFIYSGGSIMSFINGLYKNPQFNYYVNTNEHNSGMAAVGYSKTSNRTGVVMVTSGPGVTNILTPIADAYFDATPLVVFSGQVGEQAIGTNAFQEVPSTELTKSITKWNYLVSHISELEDVINDAFKIANHGKKGPVHIDIPKNIADQELDSEYRGYIPKNLEPTNTLFDRGKIEEVAKIINKAKKPIIYLGKGAMESSKLVRQFVYGTNIPVTSTIHACGIFPETQDLSLRWLGMHGSAAANKSVQEADLIIALGSRFDDRTTGNVELYAPESFKAAKENRGGIIHVNIEPKELNFVVNSHYNFCGDVGIWLQQIMPYIHMKYRPNWFNYIKVLKETYPFELKKDKDKLHMEDVLDTIYKKTKGRKNTIFTTGVGNHQMQAYQFIKSDYPGKIISSGSLGAMGAGLPYAIGSQIANPDKNIILIDGDSSFNMSLTDMKTIVEYNLPIKIVIMNNSTQAMVYIWEKLFYNNRITATENKRNPDYVSLAKSFGIPAIRCTNRKNLEKHVEILVHHKGPILCEFKIENDICLPLVSPGKALDDMILPDNVPQFMTGSSPS